MESKKSRNRPWCPLCRPSVQFHDHAELAHHMKSKHQEKIEFSEKGEK